MKEIVNKELDNIINDLNWYILIKCKTNIAEIDNFTGQRMPISSNQKEEL